MRHVGRAIAAYFSDLLLWLSVAGVLEVVGVLAMAALCILSAGYFFDSMKKNPVVLVLGGVVALTGTFLMFREVRALVLPAPPVEAPSKAAADGKAPGAGPAPAGTDCSGLSQLSCMGNPGCQWLPLGRICIKQSAAEPSARSPTWRLPPVSELSACTRLSEATCSAAPGCYWSKLFKRCENLIVGPGFLPIDPTPPQPGCSTLSGPQCVSRPDCVWFISRCTTDLLGRGRSGAQ